MAGGNRATATPTYPGCGRNPSPTGFGGSFSEQGRSGYSGTGRPRPCSGCTWVMILSVRVCRLTFLLRPRDLNLCILRKDNDSLKVSKHTSLEPRAKGQAPAKWVPLLPAQACVLHPGSSCLCCLQPRFPNSGSPQGSSRIQSQEPGERLCSWSQGPVDWHLGDLPSLLLEVPGPAPPPWLLQ